MSEKLTVAEALYRAQQIDVMLGAIQGTAPDAVEAMVALQREHRERIVEILRELGYSAKVAGG